MLASEFTIIARAVAIAGSARNAKAAGIPQTTGIPQADWIEKFGPWGILAVILVVSLHWIFSTLTNLLKELIKTGKDTAESNAKIVDSNRAIASEMKAFGLEAKQLQADHNAQIALLNTMRALLEKRRQA